MPDILRNSFPYRVPRYDDFFVNRTVIGEIGNFFREYPVLRAFYAKGSLIHGCMVVGSDIDHVRIRLYEKISLSEKIRLIDQLEKRLMKTGVSELKRVREDGYVRMFVDWRELADIHNASVRKYEVYPGLDIITARNKKDWLRKSLKMGYSYTGRADNEWAARIAARIMGFKC